MKALVVCKYPKDGKEAEICKIIKEKCLETTYVCKDTLRKKDFEGIDLVIAIGGDGTILSASHYLIDKPILAVNISPETSEGALTTLSLQQLNDKIKQILKNGYKTEKLERKQVSINNSPLPLSALNEVFIGNEKAYLISKYKLKFKNKEETQKSSGLIFSTGSGSTAWFKSALGTPFSPQSKYIKMIVREPFSRKLTCPSLLKETINENEKIEIFPLVSSTLAIDSIREYKLSPQEKVIIEISNHPLQRII